MKLKLITFVCSILCVSSIALGQTTQEEYNFLTKEYAIQSQSGKPAKNGYIFIDLGEWGSSYGSEMRKITFIAMLRDGETKPCGILMLYKRTDIPNGVVEHVCIPSPDAPEKIWKQTENVLKSIFTSYTPSNQAVIWALMKLSAQEVMR